MTKADLVRQVAEKTGFDYKDTKIIVQEFLEAIKKTLSEGKNIEIRGFGRFKVKNRKPRIARNPKKPQETFEVPARVVPIFQASDELKAIVAKK
ncbi:MAG: HU family DNA-binding protein [Candidatus Edwardsbacteria bacterium]